MCHHDNMQIHHPGIFGNVHLSLGLYNAFYRTRIRIQKGSTVFSVN